MMQAATWLDTFTKYVDMVDDKVWGTSFEVAGFPVPLLIILILFGGILLTSEASSLPCVWVECSSSACRLRSSTCS